MVTLNINNPTIEEFIKKDCENSTLNFIEKIEGFIEAQRIKSDLNQAFKELELAKESKIELTAIEDLLDDSI